MRAAGGAAEAGRTGAGIGAGRAAVAAAAAAAATGRAPAPVAVSRRPTDVVKGAARTGGRLLKASG